MGTYMLEGISMTFILSDRKIARDKTKNLVVDDQTGPDFRSFCVKRNRDGPSFAVSEGIAYRLDDTAVVLSFEVVELLLY